jgi:hypothetical protein
VVPVVRVVAVWRGCRGDSHIRLRDGLRMMDSGALRSPTRNPRPMRIASITLAAATGDAFLDQNLEAIALRLRFHPATLDDQPFDVRFRFNLTFNVR